MAVAGINVAEHVSVEWDVESFGHVWKSGIAGTYDWTTFIFLWILHVDFHSESPFLNPTNNKWGSPFSPVLDDVCFSSFLGLGHSDWGKMTFHSSFSFAFP